jgi:hypothetical protein
MRTSTTKHSAATRPHTTINNSPNHTLSSNLSPIANATTTTGSTLKRKAKQKQSQASTTTTSSLTQATPCHTTQARLKHPRKPVDIKLLVLPTHRTLLLLCVFPLHGLAAARASVSAGSFLVHAKIAMKASVQLTASVGCDGVIRRARRFLAGALLCGGRDDGVGADLFVAVAEEGTGEGDGG